MRPVFLYAIGLWLLLASGCGNQSVDTQKDPAVIGHIPSRSVESSDRLLQRNGDRIYFRDDLYSGIILERDSAGAIISRQSYYQGREEGWSEWYYPSGKINARRYYHLGEKDSVHTGWWESGQPRFEYQFHKGHYEGWFKEWYASGNRLKEIWYEGGEEKRGTGWRENGKCYMSFEVRNGRLYGLINPNLCYTLKNEQGEFIRSVRQ